jgi:hypothetical protein
MKKTKHIISIIFFVFLNSFCFGQNKNDNLNIIGCWQTVKYSTVKEEVIYPSEVKMIYKFYLDGSYEMIISNSATNQNREQNGTYSYKKNSLTLITNNGEPITDKISFVDACNLKWDVVLENENGTFQLKRTLCED